MNDWRDLLDRRRLQVLDRLGLNRGWLRELSGYYRGITIQEFWVRYTVRRMEAAELWGKKPRTGETDYRSFYAETDYFVLRQMYYHRNETFHVVADSLRRAGAEGDLCEYGSGVAPVTAWLRPRFPRWRYTVVDVPSPALDFARWRFRAHPNVEALEPGLGRDLPLVKSYDVITCFDVLEHVVNPLDVVRHLAEHLKPGGALHLNFIEDAGEENLAESAAQRAESLAVLGRELSAEVPLHAAVPNQIYGRYVKPVR
jgi:SAM-dependent methyltransferase